MSFYDGTTPEIKFWDGRPMAAAWV